MNLTKKLLGLLHKVFDPDPDQFLALRLSYNGGMTWRIRDAVLTTTVSGGIGQNLSIDLTQYTLSELVDHLAAQPGYSIPTAASSSMLSLSARVLITGEGDINTSNGDHLYGYTSLVWVYLEAIGVELKRIRSQIPEAIKQMNLVEAQDEWLDELGSYYGVKRIQGEKDASYGPRIIAEVVRPRSNNISMEKAISYYTGQQTTVTDVTVYGDLFPLYNGRISRDSQYNYRASATPLYGLFDIEYGYDLLSGEDPTEFNSRVHAIIDRLRAAGTHLRALSLKAAVITDQFTAPTDEGTVQQLLVKPVFSDSLIEPAEDFGAMAGALATFADTLTTPLDDVTGTIAANYRYNSIRKRNGAITYASGQDLAL